MTDLSTFEQYYKLADKLIEHATKELLAECARLLALNLAHPHAARLNGDILGRGFCLASHKSR